LYSSLDLNTGKKSQSLPLLKYFQRSLLLVFSLFFSFIFCTTLIFSSPGIAAEITNTSNIMSRAYRYYRGRGTSVNYAKALRLYQQAALRGNAEAQFIVGGMYYRGQGTDPNGREAFKWLLKAEQQGKFSPESLAIIGSMYLQGVGVPQNYQEAEKYLQLSADLGDISAKKNLAFMSYSGMGKDPEYSRALSLYTDVALLGDNASQNNVGLMHANGLGTDVDRVVGYAWYSLAASQGNTGAMIARNNLMVQMNFEELNRAQALAVKFFNQVEDNLIVPPRLP